jgi:formylglycine-generating enzyme required for sulfatase activity
VLLALTGMSDFYFQKVTRTLYDLHGNVWEWCADSWHDNYQGAPQDSSAWMNFKAAKENMYVLRGGSWINGPQICRSACRGNLNYRDDLNGNIGFRVVCEGTRTA